MSRMLGVIVGLGLAGNVQAGTLRQDLNYLAGHAKNNGVVNVEGEYEAKYKDAIVKYADTDSDGKISSGDVLEITCDDFSVVDVGLNGMLTSLVDPQRESFESARLRFFVSFGWSNFDGYVLSRGRDGDGYRRHFRESFRDNPSPNGEFGQRVQRVDRKYERKVRKLVTR